MEELLVPMPTPGLKTWNYGNELYSSIDRRLIPGRPRERKTERRQRRHEITPREEVSCCMWMSSVMMSNHVVSQLSSFHSSIQRDNEMKRKTVTQKTEVKHKQIPSLNRRNREKKWQNPLEKKLQASIPPLETYLSSSTGRTQKSSGYQLPQWVYVMCEVMWDLGCYVMWRSREILMSALMTALDIKAWIAP